MQMNYPAQDKILVTACEATSLFDSKAETIEPQMRESHRSVLCQPAMPLVCQHHVQLSTISFLRPHTSHGELSTCTVHALTALAVVMELGR